MSFYTRQLGLVLVGILMAACSGTKTTDSWSSQNYKGQVKNVYIIGIAKNESNQKIFEETFKKGLTDEGVKAVTSYNDLPKDQDANNREAIIQRMKINNCDAVLLTRLVGRRKVASFSGRGGYTSGGRVVLTRPSYYNNWESYYTYSRSVYVGPPPPESVDIVLLTVESVMYDIQTEEMIWSAQFETYLEGNIEKMMQLFVEEVTRDLKGKGLI